MRRRYDNRFVFLTFLKGKGLLFGLFFILTVSCAKRDSAEVVFRYANEQPEAALRSQSMIKFFKKQLEKRSNGRIKVELFFGGVLGNKRELMDFVQTGVLQGTRGGFFADANPKFILFTLPFLVDDWDQAQRLVQSDFTRKINEGARERGFHVPATGISQGFRALGIRRRAVGKRFMGIN
jgi:TRAP-type C4-dicarboxylate transport system substrate-binding protein